MNATDFRASLHTSMITAAEYDTMTPRAIAQAILRDARLDHLLRVDDLPDEPVLSLSERYVTPDALLDRLAAMLGLEWIVDDDGEIFFVSHPAELLFPLEAMKTGTALARLKYREGHPLVQVVGYALSDPRWHITGVKENLGDTPLGQAAYSMLGRATVQRKYAVRLCAFRPQDAPIFEVEDYELEPV